MNQDYQVLTQDLRSLGLQKDDSVLILSSYRSMNGLEGGKTVGSGNAPDPNFYDRTIFFMGRSRLQGLIIGSPADEPAASESKGSVSELCHRGHCHED